MLESPEQGRVDGWALQVTQSLEYLGLIECLTVGKNPFLPAVYFTEMSRPSGLVKL